MIRLLRTVAFALVVLLAITAMRPFNAADTFAAELPVHRVTVIDGRSQVHETTARTVGALLDELEIALGMYDSLHPHYRRRLENHLTIRIDRAFYIDLIVDGQREQKKIPPGTTHGVLLSTLQEGREIALLFDGDKDELITERTQPVEFSTWQSDVETHVEPLPYTTEYVFTPSLQLGVEQIRQEGAAGERRTYYTVVRIGNEEYTREFIEENVVEPVPKIIDKGTGFVLGALTNTGCPSFRYARRVTMNASAYTAGLCCTGKSPGHPLYGITASGRHVEHGIVAVDPRVIPLGTRLYVDGYGFALAADTGSAIRGYKIDLFMYNLDDALRFGRRDITVFILD